jgi:hypothetical protein
MEQLEVFQLSDNPNFVCKLKKSLCNDPPGQTEAKVCHSRATTHALTPVGNIPSHLAGPCYSMEHFHSHTAEDIVAYPIVN